MPGKEAIKTYGHISMVEVSIIKISMGLLVLNDLFGFVALKSKKGKFGDKKQGAHQAKEHFFVELKSAGKMDLQRKELAVKSDELSY